MVFPSLHIPPLSTVLKERKVSFTDFLEVLNGDSFEKMMEKIKL
jgi:hypothetical protein